MYVFGWGRRILGYSSRKGNLSRGDSANRGSSRATFVPPIVARDVPWY
jgi:hypothetical protein